MEDMPQVGIGVLWLVIGIASFLMVTMFGIIGFFFKRILTEMKDDIKKNTEETGKNKGRIELVEQQQRADTKRIEEFTQIEIRVMSEKVGDLSDSVKMFVNALAKKGLGKD
jgi:hypothetical protein